MLIRSAKRTPACLLAAFCWAASAADLPPSADTYVVAQSASNYGTQGSLNVAPGTQTLVQFDLRGLAAGATGAQLARANLRLYVNRVTVPGQIDVAVAGSAWTEAGATGMAAPAAGKSIASGVLVPVAGNYLSIDITSAARAWVDSVASNQGLLISATPANPASAAFDSKENTITSHPAQLEVTLSGPQGPAGPTGLQGPAGPEGQTSVTTVCSSLGYPDTDTCLQNAGQAKFVFVTKAGFQGNFGGASVADATCQKEASEANLKGTFLAWITYRGTSPNQRFSGSGIYHLTDAARTVLASSHTELIRGGPRTAIAYHADGSLYNWRSVWTGTGNDGSPGRFGNCLDWSTNVTYWGSEGQIADEGAWSEAPVRQSCETYAALYCFQQ